MTTINGKACVVNGKPVDKVFSNGKQVYGRNLLTGTSDKPSTSASAGWNTTLIGVYKTPKVGQEYTLSVEVPDADNYVTMQTFSRNNAGDLVGKITYTLIKSGEKAHTTFTWPDPGDSGATKFSVELAWGLRTYTGTYSYCKAKLEIGNAPTDWTPAPEDVM